MSKLADMRDRLNATSKGEWHKHEVAWGAGVTFYKVTPHTDDKEDLSEADADFVIHAPAAMCALLDGLDFALDGKPTSYVVAQLDRVADSLEAEGETNCAKIVARLAVMLERLG